MRELTDIEIQDVNGGILGSLLKKAGQKIAEAAGKAGAKAALKADWSGPEDFASTVGTSNNF